MHTHVLIFIIPSNQQNTTKTQLCIQTTTFIFLLGVYGDRIDQALTNSKLGRPIRTFDVGGVAMNGPVRRPSVASGLQTLSASGPQVP